MKLIECISVGSELGELLTIKGIGRRSVSKLVDGGVSDFDELSDFSVSKMVELEIKEHQARLIYKKVNVGWR